MTSATDTRRMEPIVADALAAKRARRGRVVHEPPVLDDLAGRLHAFLSARIDGTFSVAGLAPLAGGASKEQYRFELTWSPDGAERTDRLVLRMDPPASMVETARPREFEMLQALQGTLPVPAVHWVADEASELGRPSMICGWVTGVAAPADAPKTASGLGCTYGDRLRPLLAEQFVRHLAELHRFDWSAHELPSFERPRAGTTDAIDWRLAACDQAWEDDAFEPHPTITLTRDWLWANRPEVDVVSAVHGDYRNGNFLFDEAEGRITAILDWELIYLGDRHHDLAYVMTKGWGYTDEADGEFYCSALLTRDQLIADYERLSGLTVDPERLRYYTVLNLYWAAVATLATGPRNAAERLTHLDVMQNFVSGLGVAFATELDDLVTTMEA